MASFMLCHTKSLPGQKKKQPECLKFCKKMPLSMSQRR